MRLVDVPAHVEPALRLFLEILQRRRLDRIDRDALARRDDADDAVARHRAAVRREVDRQVGIDAADRDRRRRCAPDRAATSALQLDRQPLLLRRRSAADALFLVVGIHRARDVGGPHLAAADRRHHVVDRGARQPRQRALQLVVGVFDLGAREQPLDDAPAEAGILIAHGGARGAPDRRPRLAGDRERFPRRRRRRLRLRGQDLDLVAVLQFGRQRRELAVDLAADRAVADVGMHRIGEVDRRWPGAAARSACPSG